MDLNQKLEITKRNIHSAQKKVGVFNDIEIVAVTKTHPFDVIRKSYEAGFLSIGENKVQESLGKFESFEKMPNIKKRFIGHLQSNKVNKCLDLFDTIDSVHSKKLLKRISRISDSLKKKTQVLLEINTTGEPQKKGFLPNQIEEILSCFEYNKTEIKGLMTMAPYTDNEKEIRKSFSCLRELKDKINDSLPDKKITTLSMGMSNDYEIAIEEGSTMIRLGTYLFGKRGNI
jgi:pyridoxal phosphate enzyme (YggS family)